MNKRKQIVIGLIILIVIFVLIQRSSIEEKRLKEEFNLSYNEIITEMFPDSNFKFINQNKVRMYSNNEGYKKYCIKEVRYGRFIEDENEFLVIVRGVSEERFHAAGFFNAYLAIFDAETQKIKSSVKLMSADKGDFGFFVGQNRTYIMFVGSKTYQGWTEFNGGLYKVNGQRWKEVWPQKDGFWKDKQVMIGKDRLILYKRKLLDKANNKLIPYYKFILDKELLWNPKKVTFEEKELRENKK